MAVTAALVKELREITGAGMVDCKNALVVSDGDIKKAVDLLREKGLAAAAKKASRIAAEGTVAVAISPDVKRGVVVEVNCETDFVAINAVFKNYVAQVAGQLLDSKAAAVDDFLAERWAADPQYTVEQQLSQMVARIGEKISIRRFGRIDGGADGYVANYVHGGGKMGVLLEYETAAAGSDAAEAARNVCMQISALYPKYISYDEVPADVLEKERAIALEQVGNDPAFAKKPDAIKPRIAEGKVKAALEPQILLEQEYVKQQDIKVKDYIAQVGKAIGAPIKLMRFISYERGDGLEKRQDNFADEVNKVVNG
ncbi:MAG: translation elongation factor Ts [Clostridiales bacterium]|jgi:elongation factor Ts|nr:translation elongation factor Ts [Clostridiales bacterium]